MIALHVAIELFIKNIDLSNQKSCPKNRARFFVAL